MNWSYNKYGWYISWFNGIFNNQLRKVFHLFKNEYGIEFCHKIDNTHILWKTSKNIYWLILRKSFRYNEKAEWCFNLMKTTNDHTGC